MISDKYLRSGKLARTILDKIKELPAINVRFMEVCGSHTMAIRRAGIDNLLPENIKLISGPGCPVCVTEPGFIDRSISLAQNPDTIVATYGDLLRVPGSNTTLENIRSKGSDIRVVTSPLEALEIAKVFKNKRVVFLAIGFETTSPATAVSAIEAVKQSVNNYYILSGHKVMPPALNALANEGLNLNGLIAPGHVTAITGTEIYNALPESYNIGVVVSGFEPVDILLSILMLMRQVISNKPEVENQYSRVVKANGNIKAVRIINRVFDREDTKWRGLGIIPGSGLILNSEFSSLDATKLIRNSIPVLPEPKGCICGEIMRGLKTPIECSYFGSGCTPDSPVGACMVSSEGTCNVYFNYKPLKVEIHEPQKQ